MMERVKDGGLSDNGERSCGESMVRRGRRGVKGAECWGNGWFRIEAWEEENQTRKGRVSLDNKP